MDVPLLQVTIKENNLRGIEIKFSSINKYIFYFFHLVINIKTLLLLLLILFLVKVEKALSHLNLDPIMYIELDREKIDIA